MISLVSKLAQASRYKARSGFSKRKSESIYGIIVRYLNCLRTRCCSGELTKQIPANWAVTVRGMNGVNIAHREFIEGEQGRRFRGSVYDGNTKIQAQTKRFAAPDPSRGAPLPSQYQCGVIDNDSAEK